MAYIVQPREDPVAAGKSKRIREQVVVYLDEKDSALLEAMQKKTGHAKTELFRRGLRRLADDTLGQNKAGSSIEFLVATADTDEFPPDVAERADEYLYGGGYGRVRKRKRARSG